MSGSLTETLRETLAIFDDPGEPLTTPEVADRLELGRRSTYERLERLVDHGGLETKKVGANARVWWRPPDRRDDGSRDGDHSGPAGSGAPGGVGRPGRATDAQFQSLVDAVEEYAIFLLDPEGRVETWNPGAERIKGYAADDILGEHVSTFYTREDREAGVPERNLEVAATEGSVEDEGWRVRADGSRFWADVTITAVRDDDGDLEGFAKVTRDMTDRREREQQLRHERDLVEGIIETVPVGIGVFSPDGEMVRANERTRDVLDVTDDDAPVYLAGERELLDANGDPVPLDERPFTRVLESGEPLLDWECQIRTPEGGRRWLSVNAAPLRGDDGEVSHVVISGEDVTRLKEQARRLERQRDDVEGELDEVLERVAAAFYALDEEWRFTYVNERAEEFLRRSEAELLGRRIWEAFPETVDLLEAEFKEAMETQEPVSVEVFSGRFDRWVEVDAYPSETGMSVYFRDVGDRKRFEETLRSLHDTSRELFHAGTAADVDRTVVDAVTDILDLEAVAVYRYDEGSDELFPAAATSEVEGMREELPRVPPDDSSLTGHLYATGESRLYDDIHESPYLGTDATEMHAGVFAPLGDHGILVVASREVGAFDERTAKLVDVLAATAEGAYDRVERERELEEQRERYRQLVEVSPVAIAIYDADGTLDYVNDAAVELVGATGVDELLDESAIEFVHPDDRGPAAERMRRVIEDRERVPPRETRVVTPDGEVKHTVIASVPITDEGAPAAQVVLTDVTERKERELELAQYETIIESLDVGVYVVDADRNFQWVNEAYAEMLGYSREELIGENATMVVDDEVIREAEVVEEERGYEHLPRMDVELLTSSGDRVPVDAASTVLPGAEEDDWFRAGVVRDITERKERERELRDAKLQLEAATEAGAVGTWEWHVPEDRLVGGPSFARTFGVDPDAVREGVPLERITSSIHDDDRDAVEAKIEEALESCGEYEAEYRVRDAEGEVRWVVARGRVECDEDGDPVTFPGALTDITGRKRNERRLEESRRRYRTLVENFPNGAVALVDEDMRYRIAGGTPVDVEADTADDLEGTSIRAALSEELADVLEPRFRAALEGESSTFEREHGGKHSRFHIFPVRDDEGEVFAAMGMSQDITERMERERELERQRERLAALNNLNDVVRDITDAVIDQSTREEIETIVCERLADADSYEFAWIGEVDPRRESITPRVEAGVDGYAEAITLSTDPDDPTGRGPGGRAVRTREIQVTRDVSTDPEFEPWREYAEEYGYRSSAGIPIVHDDTLYGLIGVYADRPKAFGGGERDVLAQLGEVVGHAIAAVERKQALMSDEVTEIEFTATDVVDTAATGSDAGGSFSFERAIPIGSDAFLEYGTVDVDAIDALEAFVSRYGDPADLRIFDREGDTAQFEHRSVEPPAVSVAASHGGHLQEATVEDGDLHLTVHLPPTVPARRVIDAIQEAYPTAKLLTRRQVPREDATTRVHREVAEDLSERQRTALEAAVYSGFFEWPRETSGEEVAEAMDIAPPTFHQHLRKAQRKVFESMFPTPRPDLTG